MILHGDRNAGSVFPEPFLLYVIYTSAAPKVVGGGCIATVVPGSDGCPVLESWNYAGDSLDTAQESAIEALREVADSNGWGIDLNRG